MTGKKSLIVLFAGVFLLGSCLAALAQDAAKEEAKPEVVGLKNCKMCHSKDATGNQYAKWQASPHAKAFEVLASEESKAKAKELGIDDPQTSEKCLPCHSTVAQFKLDPEKAPIAYSDGVTCESCHGPGSEYKGLKVMKGLFDGSVKPESVGLWMPDEKLCVTCHKAEGNPFHKEFKFDEYVKKIAHPVPAEGK